MPIGRKKSRPLRQPKLIHGAGLAGDRLSIYYSIDFLLREAFFIRVELLLLIIDVLGHIWYYDKDFLALTAEL